MRALETGHENRIFTAYRSDMVRNHRRKVAGRARGFLIRSVMVSGGSSAPDRVWNRGHDVQNSVRETTRMVSSVQGHRLRRCTPSGEWTNVDAQSWWQRHQPALCRQRKAPQSAGNVPLAVAGSLSRYEKKVYVAPANHDPLAALTRQVFRMRIRTTYGLNNT